MSNYKGGEVLLYLIPIQSQQFESLESNQKLMCQYYNYKRIIQNIDFTNIKNGQEAHQTLAYVLRNPDNHIFNMWNQIVLNDGTNAMLTRWSGFMARYVENLLQSVFVGLCMPLYKDICFGEQNTSFIKQAMLVVLQNIFQTKKENRNLEGLLNIGTEGGRCAVHRIHFPSYEFFETQLQTIAAAYATNAIKI